MTGGDAAMSVGGRPIEATPPASRGIGGHQRAHRGRTDEWLTPPGIIEALGPFDLDPCSPRERPWDTAAAHYTIDDDGLAREWSGRVWLNPPYGPETGRWLERLARHGDGTALIFARTETDMFHRFVWDAADAALFIRGRLHFYDTKGNRARHNAGGPSVLIAYGVRDKGRLLAASEAGAIPGKFISIR